MSVYSFLSIGLDDVDSISGGCTTHFATYVIKKIYKYGGFLLDYPRLLRLNPDIPWKTRGNGAVALDIAMRKKFIDSFIDEVKESLLAYVSEENSSPASTQPTILILDNSLLKPADRDVIYLFSLNSTYKLISLHDAEKILNRISYAIVDLFYPNGKRGIVGALSAVGNPILKDHTYELLVYRSLKDRGERVTARESEVLRSVLKEIEDEYSFAHLDLENNKILITPAGPDPVIMGIRGESPYKIYSIFRKIRSSLSLKYESWLIYVTNQGTNDHLYNSQTDSELSLYRQILRKIRVIEKPKYEKGSHYYLDNIHLDHWKGRVYAYYESGRLRELFSHLIKNDYLEVGGGLKPYMDQGYDYVLNIEYLRIINKNTLENVRPKCPKCNVNMVSEGRNKGFKCKKCGYHIDAYQSTINIKRIPTPEIILPPLRSIKHLSKPLKRYGREKRIRVRGLRNIRFMWLNEV